jgi:hypothetical protein
MVKKLYYYLVLFSTILFATVACNSIPTAEDCQTFRTGEFSFNSKSAIRIVRTEKTQKEYSLEDEFVDEFSIEWIDDCTYVLTLLSTNKPDKEYLIPGDQMEVRITKTANKGYEYEAKSKLKNFTGTLIKLK